MEQRKHLTGLESYEDYNFERSSNVMNSKQNIIEVPFILLEHVNAVHSLKLYCTAQDLNIQKYL